MVSQQPESTGQPDEFDRSVSRHFEASRGSVRLVRRMVAEHLAATPPPRLDAALLVASELANNAVLHSRTPYVVALHIGDMLRIEVTDASPGVPRIRRVPRGAVSGRGLQIVSELSARWGVDWNGDSKVVWAELPLRDGAAG